MNERFDPLGLAQMLNVKTWSRLVNGVWRDSTLDHVYVKDATALKNLEAKETLIGDHKIVMVELNDIISIM